MNADDNAVEKPLIDVPTEYASPATEVFDASPEARPQKLQIGNYQLISEIARGGMGIVYRARQINADRDVALKVVRSNHPDSRDRHRFQAEILAAARLDHPRIVPVYEVGEFQGEAFFTMKLVEGQSLAKRLELGPLDVNAAAELVQTIADATQYAHSCQIIHRDLKPANILLDEAGRPYITDFGLARLMDRTSQMTSEGQMIGTPAFMSPEQAIGQNREIGVQTDVYSLGAILYACLTGRPPFQAATTMATVMQSITRDPVPPGQLNGEVDRDIETICLKCLEKDPERRYPAALALSDELTRYLQGEPIHARRATVTERIVKWGRRHPARAGMVLTGVLAAFSLIIAGIIGFYNVGLSTSLEQTERARVISEQQRKIAAEAQASADTARSRAEAAEYFRNITLAQTAWNGGRVDQMYYYLMKTRHADRRWEYELLSGMANQYRWQVTNEMGCSGTCMAKDSTRAVYSDFNPNRKAYFFESDSGKVTHDWTLGAGYTATLAWTDDLSKMATVRTHTNSPPSAELWDLSDPGRPEKGQEIPVEPGRFRTLLNRDGSRGVLVEDFSHGQFPGLQAVDFVTGHVLQPAGAEAFFRDGAWNEDGSELLLIGGTTATESGFLRRYRTADWSVLDEVSFPYGVLPMRLVAPKNDEDAVWVAGSDFRVRRFSRSTLELKAESASVRSQINDIDLNSVHRRIAIGLQDTTVVELDAESLTVLRRHPAHVAGVTTVSYTSDGNRIWSGSFEWRILGREVLEQRYPVVLEGHTNQIRALAFSADGRLLASSQVATVRDYDRIHLWDRATGKLVRSLPAATAPKSEHSNGVEWVGFTDNDRRLISLGWNGAVRIWNTADGTLERTFEGGNHQGIHAGAFDATLNRLYFVGEGGRIGVRDLATGELLQTFVRGSQPHFSVAVSPDGRSFMAGGFVENGSSAAVWNTASENSRATLSPDYVQVRALCYSPDGTYFVGGGIQGRLSAYHSQTCELLWQNTQHVNTINQLAFSPDGQRLVSVSDDQTVILWEPLSGEPILTLREHTAPVMAAAWSPDGKVLATAGDDRRVLLWHGKD